MILTFRILFLQPFSVIKSESKIKKWRNPKAVAAQANMKWMMLYTALFPSEKETQDIINPIRPRTISNPVIKNLKGRRSIRGRTSLLNIFSQFCFLLVKLQNLCYSLNIVWSHFEALLHIHIHDSKTQQVWIQQSDTWTCTHFFSEMVNKLSMVVIKLYFSIIFG